MTPCNIFVFLVTICCGGVSLAHAGEDFVWPPVTPEERDTGPDSSGAGRDAIMLFDHLTIDDRNLADGGGTVEVTRRIKVFTPAGRKWAEVSIPFIDDEAEVEDVQGRVILTDGREIVMSPDAVRESEVYKTEGILVRQKSFSLPGVSDGSIFEYHYRRRGSGRNREWVFQQEIPLQRGECRWRIVRNVRSWNVLRSLLVFSLTPNFSWLNCAPGSMTVLPSMDDPEEVVFGVEHVPAFSAEPWSLPDRAVKMQLQCYYSGPETPKEYWAKVSSRLEEAVERFVRDRDDLEDIIAGFYGPPANRIQLAYSWVQNNIRNTDLMVDRRGLRLNGSVDDVLDHRYGTPLDINMVFHAMVLDMGIQTRMVLAVNHNRKRFSRDLKYYQFDKSLVFVSDAPGKLHYLAPGDPLMPQGWVPWSIEGTPGLSIGSPLQQFAVVPSSPAGSNRTVVTITASLDSTLALDGLVTDSLCGHPARALALSLIGKTLPARRSLLETYWKDMLIDATLDTLPVADSVNGGGRFFTTVAASFSAPQEMADGRVLLHPLALRRRPVNPFTASIRRYPIVMEFAHTTIDRISIDLPSGWHVVSFPDPVVYGNAIGRVETHYELQGTRVEVERSFVLTQAFWPDTHYRQVRALFQQYEDATDGSVLITPNAMR